MKKILLSCMMIAFITGTTFAVDYANHMYNARIYRVALGSGTAPSASDVSALRLHNGDMILNTDDDVLYVMHATNVYTKFTSAGVVTVPTFTPGAITCTGSVSIGVNANISGATTTKTFKATVSADVTSNMNAGSYSVDGQDGHSGSITSVNNVVKQTGAVTASGANNLVTPTATMTLQKSTIVTQSVTVTKQTGAVTASGANDLVTPTGSLTPQTVIITNYVTPVFGWGIFTNENFSVTNVFSAVTNITWTENVLTVMTNGTIAITPNLASNSVVVVTVTGGGAVVTNATAEVAIPGDNVTNATCAILPELASNSVVAVTVTGGGAVVTNLTYGTTLSRFNSGLITNAVVTP